MHRFSPPALLVASIVAATCFVRPAAAEEPAAPRGARDPAAAEALFRAGIAALDKGDWDTACPKFVASAQLDPSAGTSINIARCLEHRGKTAQAWAELGRARTLAREASDVRRRELEAFVDREIARVEARLARLRIVAKALPPDAEISRDGIVQSEGVVGEALPVDPGEHVVEVRAPGRVPAKWKVQAVEGGVAEIVVEVGPRETEAARHDDGAAQSPGDDGDPRDSTIPVLGIVLTGVGLAGLAVGLITGLNAITAKDDIVALGCNDDAGTCPDAEARRRADDYASRGADLAAVSTTAFIGGSLLGASGATILVVNAISANDASTAGRPRPAGAARLSVAPAAAPSGGGVWVHGAF